MAGRGPAPKPNALRRNGNAPSPVVELRADADGFTPAPIPAGDWHPNARLWWAVASRSTAARHLWQPEDLEAARRCLLMVDRWERNMEAGKDAEAARQHGELRRLESALHLYAADRLRAGLPIDRPTATSSTVAERRAAIRARLTESAS